MENSWSTFVVIRDRYVTFREKQQQLENWPEKKHFLVPAVFSMTKFLD